MKFIFSNLLTTLYPFLNEMDGEKKTLDAMISDLYLQPDISEIVRMVQELASRIIGGFSSGPSIRREILEVTDYIGANYGKELSVERLASIVFLTPDYLSRLFKKSMGKSISQYIRQFRMEKARELLTGTNRKVIDIGEAVGYPNYSYFCQSFREYFGTSPERYRQERRLGRWAGWRIYRSGSALRYGGKDEGDWRKNQKHRKRNAGVGSAAEIRGKGGGDLFPDGTVSADRDGDFLLSSDLPAAV